MKNYSRSYRRTINLGSDNINIYIKIGVFLLFATLFSIFPLINIILNLDSDSVIVFNIIGINIFISMVGYIIYKYRKRIVEDRISFQLEYIKEPPSNHPPAIISYLLQGENYDGSDLTATLIDLVDKGYLNIIGEYSDKMALLDSSKNIVLIRNNQKSYEQLLEYEKYLLNWFINDIGDGKKVSTKDIRENLFNDSKSGHKFREWGSLVIKDYEKQNFSKYVPPKKNLISGLVLCIGFVMGGYSFFGRFTDNLDLYQIFGNGVVSTISYYMIQCSFLYLIFFANNNKPLTDKGRELTYRWNAFKKYINDYTLIEEKELESVVIFNKYLTYSIALGCANVAIKTMAKNYGWELYKVNSSNKLNVIE